MQTVARRSLLGILIALMLVAVAVPPNAGAAYGYRQRYSSWSYYPTRTYYYRTYHYKPYSSYDGYKHHYCIYYPSRPRYVYYYNPVRRVYWGRYDLREKGYSMLEEKDRHGDLEKIAEEAFPEPGKMPVIPESEDGERIEPIAANDLPSSETPEDAPSQ